MDGALASQTAGEGASRGSGREGGEGCVRCLTLSNKTPLILTNLTNSKGSDSTPHHPSSLPLDVCLTVSRLCVLPSYHYPGPPYPYGTRMGPIRVRVKGIVVGGRGGCVA